MSITLDMPAQDIAILEEEAKMENLSVEEFSKAAIMKAVRNRAYLRKLERADIALKEGRVVTFTNEEWERFISI